MDDAKIYLFWKKSKILQNIILALIKLWKLQGSVAQLVKFFHRMGHSIEGMVIQRTALIIN